MHLRVIVPTVVEGEAARAAARYRSAASPGTQVSAVTLPAGTRSLGSRRDVALAAPWVLIAARDAAAEGCDAIVVDSMLDPGVPAAREVVGIPVLGPAEASMHLAATLGHGFAVISVDASRRILLIEQARRSGVESHLVSVRSSVLGSFDDLVRCAREAIELDHAEVIVLDHAGEAGKAAAVQRELALAGFDVPVIDPFAAAVHTLETIVAMGLGSSRRTYPRRSGATSSWPTTAITG